MNKIITALISAAALGVAACSAESATEEVSATEEAFSTGTARITCESGDYHYNSCGAPGTRIQSARVLRQLSSLRCEQGQSWGFEQNYIWVNHGCRAEFEVRWESGSSGGRRIRVLDATYGGNVGGSFGNATRSVSRQCDSRSTCDYLVSANELGDPAWGQPKDFFVRWTCDDGSQPHNQFVGAEAEGRWVHLSCDSWEPPPPPPPPPPGGCGVLSQGQSLYQNQGVRSCNGRANFVHQNDGNVVLYDGNRVLAATHINDWNSSVLTMQDDGNLVQYSRNGQVIWSSNTAGNYGASLRVQDDCNVVIYDRGGRAVWHTNTAGCVAEH